MRCPDETWVDATLGHLTLEQKVGQVLVFGFCGPIVTPDVTELVDRFHLGGLRVTTKFRGLDMVSDLPPSTELPDYKARSWRPAAGLARDYAFHAPAIGCTPGQYAATLAGLRQRSRQRPAGVPLHFACDQEGNAVDDMVCGTRLFPHPFAYGLADDVALTEACATAIGRQLRALGIDMIHSPVLDVNTDPRNPEVGTRAFGEDPDLVIRHGLATLRGFAGAGLAATGKHFPGRGHSTADAHHGLPAVELDRETLERDHVRPFRALIAAGLPAIMVAHSRYPALGVIDDPASCSERLLRGYLREELGFDGVIETDNMMMGGVLQRFPLTEACVRVLEAGCDLVLLRDEGPARLEVWQAVYDAVANGRYSESRLDESVRRVLRLRSALGLADDDHDTPTRAEEPIHAPATIAAAQAIAACSVRILRDRAARLPLDASARVLLVEQVFPTHQHANNVYSHPGLLWEAVQAQIPATSCCEIPYRPGPGDIDRVKRRLDQGPWDAVITTSWYYHKDGPGGREVRELLGQIGLPLVVIANSPYAFAAPEELDTVIITLHPGAPEQLAVVAERLVGR